MTYSCAFSFLSSRFSSFRLCLLHQYLSLLHLCLSVCMSVCLLVSLFLFFSLSSYLSLTSDTFFYFLSLSISVYNSIFISYPLVQFLSVFFGSSSSDLSFSLSFCLSLSLSLSLSLFLSLSPSVSLILSIFGSYPLHALSLLLSFFHCLYLPISFFLSLLCASSLFSEYYIVNIVSASKSVYQSVFHYNYEYINCSSFFFPYASADMNVFQSLSFSLCFLSLLYSGSFGGG